MLIEWWRQTDNTVRLHSALGYGPPLPQTIQPSAQNENRLTL